MLEIGSQGLAHARQALNHKPSPHRNIVCGEEHAVTLSRSATHCRSSEQVSSVPDRWGVSMGRQKAQALRSDGEVGFGRVFLGVLLLSIDSTMVGYFLAYNSANLLNILLNMHPCSADEANFWLFPPSVS